MCGWMLVLDYSNGTLNNYCSQCSSASAVEMLCDRDLEPLPLRRKTDLNMSSLSHENAPM